MITDLEISNFKLHDYTKLGIGRLAVLTGMNGMGKSSVIQLLVLLRQSFMMNDLETGLNLKGDLYDAGTSGDLVCQASDEHRLNVGLKFQGQADLNYSFSYPKFIFDTFLPGEAGNVTKKDVLSAYSLFNENFQYLSAFRFGPQRSYNRDTSLVVTKRQISKIMGQCEYTVHFLYHNRYNDIPVAELAITDGDVSPDLRLSVQVERWMRRICPNVRINIAPEGEDFKLNYRFNRDENMITADISALNTGFGITYVLPILVAILSARKDALVIIENPEAHLHPKGQAVLMELMAKAVAHGMQIIVETHSDHIINGGLVAVNKEIITPEQISVHYFERDEHSHTAVSCPLEITRSGHINHPPKGFFDQIDIDMKTLMGF